MNDWARRLLDEELLTGCAFYEDQAPGDTQRRIVVRARIGPSAAPKHLFILDTGAPWNVVPMSLLERFQIDYAVMAEATLIADWGTDLAVDGTFFAIDDRYAPSQRLPYFLGYGGCLEWIRFALDPAANLFCFGAAG